MSSEVARIRQQIADEYLSAQRIFTDFVPTAKHEFMTARAENLANHFEELKKHLPEDQAMQILIEESNKQPPTDKQNS